jgi:membrane protein required for colicin V production
MMRLGDRRQSDDNPASFPNGGGMTWVDLAVFGFLLISGLLAFVRGLVREVLGVGAWAGSLALAFFALPTMRGIVHQWIPQPQWVDPASFIVVFIISLIVLMLIARAIGGLVRRSALGGVDRTLGLVFGLARGAAVVIVAYIIGQMVFPIERWPDTRTLPAPHT